MTLAQAGRQMKQQTEQLAWRPALQAGASVADIKATRVVQADYLDSAKKAASRSEAIKEAADASVGFGAVVGAPAGTIGGKGDSKLIQAYANLGEKTVSGVWSYQGSKPFVYRESLYSAMGNTLKCVDTRTEKLLWEKSFQKKDRTELTDRTLTPPALVNGKIFLCTVFGDVLCLSASSGAVLWTAHIGEPIVFQPAVVKGRVYLAGQGSLYCIETGDPQDDGWFMWRAGASHNGLSN